MPIVTNILDRTVNTSRGPAKVYSVEVDGVKHSYGFTKPKFGVGDSIEFVAEEDSYGPKMDPKTVRVISKGSGAAPAATGSVSSAPRPYSGPPAKVFPVPLLHGDRSIIRQNALTNARELYTAMIPAMGNVPSEEDVANIIKIARMFEEYSAGDIERRAAEEGAE